MEIKQVLINMKNNKSPGPDGFTVEFYKFFFKDIGIFLVRSFNEGISKGELSVTQYQGVITCIPKEGKPKQFIKNWRPISLLNVSYKLLSSCLASRMKSVLPLIIHDSQKGFMKGRFIGENIRLLYDTLLLTEKENIPGLLLMVDFEKAFDSVSWLFIEKALHFFNFPNSIIFWFKVLYKKPNSCVSFNGQYSAWFELCRGCRQGDPIAPYLYLVCAEILSLMIRNNKKIKGITLREKEILLSLFADDTTLFLDGTEQSFREAIKMLDTFSAMSGLNVNNDKTQISWIGSMKNCNIKYMRDKNFIWDPGSFKVLGIMFSTNTERITSLNFEGKIEEVKREISRWKRRNMTPLGRITIIKTLLIPKLTHLFISLPDPPQKLIKELDEIIYRFMWGGKTHKIKKSVMCKSYEEGGYKMINISDFISTLKIGWLRRLNLYKRNGTRSAWADLNPILLNLPNFGQSYAKFCMDHINNPFWNDVLKYYTKLLSIKRKKILDVSDIIEEPILFNGNIRRNRQVITDNDWEEQAIFKIKHILDDDSKVLRYNDFLIRYINVRINPGDYNGISRAVTRFLNNVINQRCRYNKMLCHEVWACIDSGNSSVNNLLQNDNDIPTASKKWNLEFVNLNWRAIFKKCMYNTTDPQLQWFQARLLHRILPTQKYLSLCKLADSATCVFCKNDIESLNHLFWDCYHVKMFWTALMNLLHEKCTHCIRLSFTKELIMFGLAENIRTDSALDSIILYAKFFIYKCKLRESLPILEHFLHELSHRVIVEKAIAFSQGKQRLSFEKWQLYRQIF